MNANEPKDIKLITKLRMKDNLTFTAMCPACYSLFNITIPKAKVDFEYTTHDTTDTLSVHNSSLADPNAYCELLQLKHNCTRAYLQLSLEGCGPFLVQIDDKIAEAVSLFNKNGFPTLYSCQGHIYRDGSYSRPYIMFDIKRDVRGSEKYLEMLRTAILDVNNCGCFCNISYDDQLSDGTLKECADFDPCVQDANLVLSIYNKDEDHVYTDTEFENFCLACWCIANRIREIPKGEKKEGD